MDTIKTKNQAAEPGSGSQRMNSNLNLQLSRKEKKGLKVIKSHAGKEVVFKTYLENKPEIARKYLRFISKHQWVRYVKFDVGRQDFVIAS